MENFFHDDRFYSSIEDFVNEKYADSIGGDKETLKVINELPDDYKETAFDSSLEPIFQLTPDWIMDHIDEERYTEEGTESDKIYKQLKKFDFTEFNEKVPKLYYETSKKFNITKADLLEALT